jgi:hypothetical protein
MRLSRTDARYQQTSQTTGPGTLLIWVKLGRKLDVRAVSAFPTITDTTVATSGVYEFKP